MTENYEETPPSDREHQNRPIVDQMFRDEMAMSNRIGELLDKNVKLSKIILVQSWAIGRLKNLIGHSDLEYAEGEAETIIEKVREEQDH